ncbi:NUDIX domain-containing protein [Streptosporangium soli]|nr:NUDIX domain-containing protein [Streptosporangium sp. KLBMP 9127]
MVEAISRPSARILLVDDRERVLLYRGLGMTKKTDYAWFTPGGGVNPGEALTAAAARELREETGRSATPEAFGPVVATSSGHWTSADGRLFHSEDYYFFLRVPEFQVDISGMEDRERSLLDTHRWWTLPDLRSTGENLIPPSIAVLLDRLLAEGAPSEPVLLPWHHPQ